MTRRSRLPERIGDYRILERIAVGTQAEVFKAQRRGGPLVCLKRIFPEHCDDAELVERFLEEIALAKQLRHSNIVAVYDHGEDRGHFYVMELIDGMDLGNLLHRSGPLSPELVVLLGTELAKALIYVHHSDSQTGRKPLVHCDVTPHNVLIGRDGAVKLSDFGIAKALRKTGAETITRARGKPWYLSPEQWEGGKVGAHSDLFSLGLVLWRALVGTHPYAEGRPSDVMLETWIRERTLANARERTVAEAAPGAPPALQEVIEGLLQLPPKRTRAAEQVWNALLPLRPIDGSAKLAELISEVAAGGHR